MQKSGFPSKDCDRGTLEYMLAQCGIKRTKEYIFGCLMNRHCLFHAEQNHITKYREIIIYNLNECSEGGQHSQQRADGIFVGVSLLSAINCDCYCELLC